MKTPASPLLFAVVLYQDGLRARHITAVVRAVCRRKIGQNAVFICMAMTMRCDLFRYTTASTLPMVLPASSSDTRALYFVVSGKQHTCMGYAFMCETFHGRARVAAAVNSVVLISIRAVILGTVFKPSA